MMEENKDIFLAGVGALVNLAGLMRKIYSTTFVWDHPFSTHVSFDELFNPLPPCTHMYVFRVTPFGVRDFIYLILLLSHFDFTRLP